MNYNQEINFLKVQISRLTQQIHNINNKLHNNIGITGPPGPQGLTGPQGPKGFKEFLVKKINWTTRR